MNPPDDGSYFRLGKVFRSQGRWPEAEAALLKALEFNPQNGWARLELGALCLDQARFAEAEAQLNKIIAIDRNNGGAHCQLGRIYHRQGRWPEAEAALRKALELDPRDGGARLELAALYLDETKLPEAEAELNEAIALDGKNSGAHFQLGWICHRQERWPEAETALRKALELDPRNGRARVELGVLFEGQARFSEAAAELEAAIALDCNDGWALCQLGRVYRRLGRPSEAAAALTRALELDPRNGCARIEFGALYEDQGKFKEAGAEFEQALAIDPDNGWVHRQLGRICFRQGRASDAEASLLKAQELDPRDDGVRVELGALYQDQDRFPEAEARFRDALAINPRSSNAHLHLGRIHCSRGRRPEAAAEFEKAVVLDPRNVAAHLELGKFHLRRGRWPEAEAEFQRAVELDSRNDSAYIGLWATCRGQGRTAEAEAALAKALAIDPRSVVGCAELQEGLDREKSVAVDPPRERVFCLLPWTHLHVRADGSARPCCAWSGPLLGNARSATLAELWNSPVMKSLRLDLMNGRPVAGCRGCRETEQSGFWSMRQRKNVELDRHCGRERLTAPDGTLPQLPVPLLEIRLSNVCNLRCRTCDPTQSSAWAADAAALGLPMEGGPIQRPFGDGDSLWRQLRPLLEEGLEEIVFAGGEPLIMEEHYRILDFLLARGLTDVRLNYITNFSTLRFQGRDVIALWSRFRDVTVAASLDGSGRRGEYLRKGLRWEAAVANREEMLRRCPDVTFSIAATLSIFNALHLPEFQREWVERGLIRRDEFRLNVLMTPEIYRTQVLPQAFKERVRESYLRHQESFLDVDGLAACDFRAAQRFMEEKDCSGLLPGFVAMTRRLDQLRGEDCREVFPELAPLFEAVR